MPTIEELRREAAGCTRCDLYLSGTQTVFGEGSPKADVVFVGEQPGDQEDKAGRPFVGPAGKLLDRALEEAGIDRGHVYVTNAVKHFKWVARGKRRIHQKPNAAEIAACRLWLDGELAALEPRVLVALGATAAQALYGRSFRVTQMRGVPVDSPLAPLAFATIHPSAVLRADDREGEFRGLVDDLRVVAKHL
jgi:DNA polymerase